MKTEMTLKWRPISEYQKGKGTPIIATHFPSSTHPPLALTHWGSIRANDVSIKCWKQGAHKSLKWEPTHFVLCEDFFKFVEMPNE